MNIKELSHIAAAILVFTAVSGFYFALKKDWDSVSLAFLFSVIIIVVNISAKKIMAGMLDSDIEHEIFKWQRYGLRKAWYFRKPIAIGILLPLIVSVFSLGLIKLTTFLTFETRAKKIRASRRFGFYSYTEMTDWHNGLIGAAGIVSVLILSLISYLTPYSGLEYLSKLSAYYAFWNILPISKLDGAQIFFGSRTLWTTLAVVTLIFACVPFLVY